MTWEEISAAITEKVGAAKSSVKTEGMSAEEAEKAVNGALATELRNLPHEVRQFLHDGGHRQATAQNKEKLEALEAAKKALESEKTTLAQQVDAQAKQIREIEANVPDADKMREKLQKEFADREKELQTQRDEAITAAAELRESRKADRVDGFESRLRGLLGSRVTEEGQEWMRNRVDRMRLDGRFLPREGEDGSLSVAVLRPNSSELEYHASNSEELLSVVAQEVLEGAPKWAIKSNVQGGGGAGSGGSGGTNGWDKIRENTRNRGGKDQDALASRRNALLPQD